MGSYVVGAAVLLCIILAVASVYRSKKKGGCGSCGNDCCKKGGCH